MRTTMEYAIANLDDSILDPILEERYRLVKQAEKRIERSDSIKRFISSKEAARSLAFVLAAVCLIVAALIHQKKILQQDTSALTKVPEYAPANSAPDFETLYQMEPFSYMLPRTFPSDLVLKISYMSEDDAIVSHKKGDYMNLFLETPSGDTSMGITSTVNLGEYSLPNLSDPESYLLSYFYEAYDVRGENNLSWMDRRSVLNVVFRPEDLTEEIVSCRICCRQNGLYVANVRLLFNDRILSYEYSGEKITAKELYNCITSAEYFRK